MKNINLRMAPFVAGGIAGPIAVGSALYQLHQAQVDNATPTSKNASADHVRKARQIALSTAGVGAASLIGGAILRASGARLGGPLIEGGATLLLTATAALATAAAVGIIVDEVNEIKKYDAHKRDQDTAKSSETGFHTLTMPRRDHEATWSPGASTPAAPKPPSLASDLLKSSPAILGAGFLSGGIAGIFLSINPAIAPWKITGGAGAAAALAMTGVGLGFHAKQQHKYATPQVLIEERDVTAFFKEHPEVRAGVNVGGSHLVPGASRERVADGLLRVLDTNRNGTIGPDEANGTIRIDAPDTRPADANFRRLIASADDDTDGETTRAELMKRIDFGGGTWQGGLTDGSKTYLMRGIRTDGPDRRTSITFRAADEPGGYFVTGTDKQRGAALDAVANGTN